MTTDPNTISRTSEIKTDYKWGFITDIESETLPKGLTEETVKFISRKKGEPDFMLEWRLKAYHHFMKLLESESEPDWAMIEYPKIDFQDMHYYSAPVKQLSLIHI